MVKNGGARSRTEAQDEDADLVPMVVVMKAMKATPSFRTLVDGFGLLLGCTRPLSGPKKKGRGEG